MAATAQIKGSGEKSIYVTQKLLKKYNVSDYIFDIETPQPS